MLSEKEAFFLALNELAKVDPWIVYADPEHDISRIKMLVIGKLRQLGLQELAAKIQKRANRKLIDWFKQWCILKKLEYEKIGKTQIEQASSTIADNKSAIRHNNVSSHKEGCNKQDYVTKSIRPDPRIVALYNFLKNHPEFGKILTEVIGINSLEEFINLSAIAYWRSKGFTVELVDSSTAVIIVDYNQVMGMK